jgi:putative tryptophan/tyrosine transport system substrate-binding protein
VNGCSDKLVSLVNEQLRLLVDVADDFHVDAVEPARLTLFFGLRFHIENFRSWQPHLRSSSRIFPLECAMRRRDFVILLVSAAANRPTTAAAQKQGKSPVIGFMGAGTPSSWSQWTEAFLQRLRELGWVDGRNIAIEYRWAEGSTARYAEIAREFVRLRVDLIFTTGGEAAKEATSSIPIVGALMPDPVEHGLVGSLARPGGNVTGLSLLASDLAGKRLELLREVVPDLRRIGILAQVSTNVVELSEARTSANVLGLEVVQIDMQRADDIAPAFKALNGRVEALYVPANPLANTNRIRINELARDARMPTVHGFRQYVESGGLMSYGPSTTDLFRRAGDYVDKILRGGRPADMPVEQPTKFELIVNLRTAKALGITLSPALLGRADEVIE